LYFAAVLSRVFFGGDHVARETQYFGGAFAPGPSRSR
jgi:hypothetical protein